jgi:glycine amidinotransferase
MPKEEPKAKVWSWNEWDPLKRLILGRPEGTQVAGPEPGLYSHQPEGGYPIGTWGMYPQEMVDEANEQMDNFYRILTARGIAVDRVEVHPVYKEVRGNGTPDWTMPNVRGTNCPRDLFMTVGNEIMEAAGALRSRWYEYLNLRPIFERYFNEDPECLWTAAPKPRMTDESYERNYWYNYYNVWTDEEKRKHMEESRFDLTDKEPMWDAACCMRMGKDIFWYHSCVTNNAGIDWLKRYFGAKGIRIHDVQFGTTGTVFYAFHIDVIICPIRPGLLIHNPTRPFLTEEAVQLFKKNDWEIIEAVGPTFNYNEVLDSFGTPRKGPNPIYFNTLSLGPNTICVEAHEERYIEQLTKLGVEVIPVPYDKVVPFGGSLHCTTVDVHREGKCEDYFPKQVPGF